MLLYELPARLHLVAHEDSEDPVRLHCILQGDPKHDPPLRIHGSLPELLGVHLTQALVPLNDRFVHACYQLVKLLIAIGVIGLLSLLDLIEGGWAMNT